MKKRVILVSILLTLLLSGCADPASDTRIFVISDTSASLILMNMKEERVLLASLPLTALAAYRGTLMKEGVQATPVDAFERLMGLSPDIIITGEQEQWTNLYQGIGAATYVDRLTFLKQGEAERVLSGIRNLSIEGESGGEVENLLSFYRDSEYVLRVYQMATFFTGRGISSLLERNTQEWLNQARREIESRSTE